MEASPLLLRPPGSPNRLNVNAQYGQFQQHHTVFSQPYPGQSNCATGIPVYNHINYNTASTVMGAPVHQQFNNVHAHTSAYQPNSPLASPSSYSDDESNISAWLVFLCGLVCPLVWCGGWAFINPQRSTTSRILGWMSIVLAILAFLVGMTTLSLYGFGVWQSSCHYLTFEQQCNLAGCNWCPVNNECMPSFDGCYY
eukprot:TRINITY_DN37033_c0_g1_i1.p1 TRINITY_DN37033_c0_g1~~TRINITY_DN37033_c0_g1_i1.p1  ORF type:complete len:204 (+),score=9.14 TRINITY_DN37033_c0_g1_i1:22-612(+)